MAAPTVTPTASAEKFDIPPYVVVLALAVPWVTGTVWMLQWDMSLSDAVFGGLVFTIAVDVALLLLVPVLVCVVIPTLMGVAIAVWAAAVLLYAVATGFMSGLRSAAAGRRPVYPPHE